MRTFYGNKSGVKYKGVLDDGKIGCCCCSPGYEINLVSSGIEMCGDDLSYCFSDGVSASAKILFGSADPNGAFTATGNTMENPTIWSTPAIYLLGGISYSDADCGTDAMSAPTCVLMFRVTCADDLYTVEGILTIESVGTFRFFYGTGRMGELIENEIIECLEDSLDGTASGKMGQVTLSIPEP